LRAFCCRQNSTTGSSLTEQADYSLLYFNLPGKINDLGTIIMDLNRFNNLLT
jgi:hypothetical protein